MSTNTDSKETENVTTEDNVPATATASASPNEVELSDAECHEDEAEVTDQAECALGQPMMGRDTGISASGVSASQTTPLSKNQMKKLKKKEHWLQVKAEKRKAEKEKKKKRHAELRERGEEARPSRKALKKNRMVDSACRQRVVIDCSFDSYMTEKDSMFLVEQIRHSYAANRRADNPLQLYICGVSGKAKQRLDSLGDYKGWDFHKDERHFAEAFPKDQIVYLSSDSPNILDRLDDGKVYVIGGLVDHNHHKGLCHRLAEERGLSHAQLPIGHFLQLKTRKVLTINHVFETLLRFTETRDWQRALLAVLPQRKGACLKAAADNGKSEADPPHNAEENGAHEDEGGNASTVVKEEERVAEDCEKLCASSSSGGGSGGCLVEAASSEDAVNSEMGGGRESLCPCQQAEASEDMTASQEDVGKESA